jgi:hypothetical protein
MDEVSLRRDVSESSDEEEEEDMEDHIENENSARGLAIPIQKSFKVPVDIVSELKGEAIFALAMPLCSAVCIITIASVTSSFSDLSGGKTTAEWSSFILMAVLSCRALLRDVELLQRYRLTKRWPTGSLAASLKVDLRKIPTSPLLMSKLEVADAISNGAALAATQLLEKDPTFRQRLLFTCSQTGLAAGLDILGLSGFMALSLTGALLAGWAVVSMQVNLKLAGMAGLGAAEREWGNECDDDVSLFYIYNTHILFQSIPQLIWQTSGLMAKSDSLLSSPILLSSLALTLVTITKQGLTILGLQLRKVVRRSASCGILSVAIYFALRVAMIEICPSHACNLSLGCIEFPRSYNDTVWGDMQPAESSKNSSVEFSCNDTDQQTDRPCRVLLRFATLWDKGDPDSMQQAMRNYTTTGTNVRLALTNRRFILIYRRNLGKRLEMYGRLTHWDLKPSWTITSFSPTKLSAERYGKITLHINWAMRLPMMTLMKTGSFPESSAWSLQNCHGCLVKQKVEMLKENATWLINSVIMLKMEE